jgi:1-acyl-sn-glycerol-3-phosphate acyltransferase
MNTLYWFTRLAAESAARAFLSLRIVNGEKAVREGGAVIACNHASFLDPPLVATVYQAEVHYLARNTLFKGVFGRLIRALNAVPVDRDQADLTSIKTIIRTLRQGNRVLIFPEGTRTETGDLLDAKAGVGMLIAKSGVPVQPVRLFGTYEAMPKGRGLRRHPVTAVVGDPIVFTKEELKVKSREAYQAIADRVMKAIADLEER